MSSNQDYKKGFYAGIDFALKVLQEMDDVSFITKLMIKELIVEKVENKNDG